MRGLIDAEVQAHGDVDFSCEVSRAGATDVQWRLQGLPLQSNEVTDVAVRGCTHMLRLRGVTPEDAGTISFHVGRHTSSAQLTVRGSSCQLVSLLTALEPQRPGPVGQRVRPQGCPPLGAGNWQGSGPVSGPRGDGPRCQGGWGHPGLRGRVRLVGWGWRASWRLTGCLSLAVPPDSLVGGLLQISAHPQPVVTPSSPRVRVQTSDSAERWRTQRTGLLLVFRN